MKKKSVLVLVLILCFCLTACGAAASGTASVSTATPEAAVAPAAAPTAQTAVKSEVAQYNLQELVDSLNEEEVAQHTDDDPSLGVFELGTEPNTIIYKFSMHIFRYVIMMAEKGDQENMSAYNRMIESLPNLENALESALRASYPELNIQVYMMMDEYSGDVTAVIEDGEIIFDGVNGVGTMPTGVKPIVNINTLSPEERAAIEEMNNALLAAAQQ